MGNPEKANSRTETSGENINKDVNGTEILNQNSGNMPPFEEWREQVESEEDEIRLERSEFDSGVKKTDMEPEKDSEGEVDEQFSKVTENNEQKAEAVEKAAENEKKAFPEEIERNGLKYRLAGSGEESAIYRAEKKDGGVTSCLESEYFDKAHDFLKAHNEIKNETGAMKMLEMEGLAFDLALVDSIGDKYFDDGKGDKALEDYGKLQEYLDNPKVSETEKAAIKEYLDETMDGEAMRLLKSKYEERDADKSAEKAEASEEQLEELEKIKDRLDETRREIEKQQDFVNGSMMEFDKSLEKIEEAMESRSMDVDELWSELRKLDEAVEGVESSVRLMEDNIDDYLSDVLKNEEQLLGESDDGGEFIDRYVWALKREEDAATAKKKVWMADEYKAKVRNYIARAEDVLAQIRRI